MKWWNDVNEVKLVVFLVIPSVLFPLSDFSFFCANSLSCVLLVLQNISCQPAEGLWGLGRREPNKMSQLALDLCTVFVSKNRKKTSWNFFSCHGRRCMYADQIKVVKLCCSFKFSSIPMKIYVQIKSSGLNSIDEEPTLRDVFL